MYLLTLILFRYRLILMDKLIFVVLHLIKNYSNSRLLLTDIKEIIYIKFNDCILQEQWIIFTLALVTYQTLWGNRYEFFLKHQPHHSVAVFSLFRASFCYPWRVSAGSLNQARIPACLQVYCITIYMPYSFLFI